jgi:hypothetical protein
MPTTRVWLPRVPSSDPKAFDPATPFYINTSDTINRNSTVSVTLFHGAPSPDKAYLSTMWVLLGQAVCAAAFQTNVTDWVFQSLREAFPDIRPK